METKPFHLQAPEQIAKDYGWKRIAVIAGVGTREYYKKLGYTLGKTYMLKNL